MYISKFILTWSRWWLSRFSASVYSVCVLRQPMSYIAQFFWPPYIYLPECNKLDIRDIRSIIWFIANIDLQLTSLLLPHSHMRAWLQYPSISTPRAQSPASPTFDGTKLSSQGLSRPNTHQLINFYFYNVVFGLKGYFQCNSWVV